MNCRLTGQVLKLWRYKAIYKNNCIVYIILMNRSVLLVLVDKEIPNLKPKVREDLLTLVLNAINNPDIFLHKCKELDCTDKNVYLDNDMSLILQARQVIRKYGLIKYDPSENIKIYNKLCDIPDQILKYYQHEVFYDVSLSLRAIHFILSHWLLQLYQMEGLENELIFYIAKNGWLTPKKVMHNNNKLKAIKYSKKSKTPHPIQERMYLERLRHIYFTRSSQPKFWSKRPIRLSGDFV